MRVSQSLASTSTFSKKPLCYTRPSTSGFRNSPMGLSFTRSWRKPKTNSKPPSAFGTWPASRHPAARAWVVDWICAFVPLFLCAPQAAPLFFQECFRKHVFLISVHFACCTTRCECLLGIHKQNLTARDLGPESMPSHSDKTANLAALLKDFNSVRISKAGDVFV